MSEQTEDRKPLIDMVRKVESDLKTAGLEFLVGKLAKAELEIADLVQRLSNTTAISNSLHAKLTEMAEEHQRIAAEHAKEQTLIKERCDSYERKIQELKSERDEHRDRAEKLQAELDVQASKKPRRAATKTAVKVTKK